MAVSNWALQPGDKIKRTDLHRRYGGRRQGGIGPSRSTANVFIFSDPITGKKYGYFDEWKSDGCYHYTGEGQHGDQEMKSGNASILRHREEGRALHLFKGVRGIVEYVAEFQVDTQVPFYTMDAPETAGVPVRSVIVFRLKPVNGDAMSKAGGTFPPPNDSVKLVPVEEQFAERFFVEPGRESYEAERRESKLVRVFSDYLRLNGYTVQRLQVMPSGEAKPIFSDLYVSEIPFLIEAKGTVTRDSIRMALGQLMDYRRFVSRARCAILVPSQPRSDLVELVKSVDVELYWPENGDFKVNF
jgi:hypothetical protein